MKIILNFLLFLFLFSSILSAQPVEYPRTILGLYDSTEEFNESEDHNIIHHNAAMVLNYLGMKVRYYDINQGLPNEEKMEDVYGILSWFRDEKMIHAEAYCQWAVQQIQEGKKFVILENMGAYKDTLTDKETPLKMIEEVFKALDLEYQAEWTSNSLVIEVVDKDPRVVEFERTLEKEVGTFEKIISNDQNNKVYLRLKRTDMEDSESAAVVTNE